MKRIGIFAGSFDPIHKGHISFALKALQSANLNEIYFVPETKPRGKQGVTHIAHRMAMLKLATKPYNKLKVLDLLDKQFSVSTTLPRLQKLFPNSRLLLLLGSDVFEHLPDWPLADRLLGQVGIIIGVRAHSDTITSFEKANRLTHQLLELHIIESDQSLITSRDIRRAIGHSETADGLLPSVSNYINKHWLYASL